MSIPHVRGRVAAQAHVDVPEGTFEEEYARNGFSGRYAHLYRLDAPVGWTSIDGPLRPRAFDLRKTPGLPGDDYLAARFVVAENADVRILFARVAGPMGYFFRNADGDELVFVHEGSGVLETDFGPLAYAAGDYLLVPRGTAHRLAPATPTQLLIVEAASEITFPERGMLGQHALFDPAVVVVPTPDEAAIRRERDEARRAGGREYELRILRAGEITRVRYPFHPLDAIGWKGTLSPCRLSTKDIRPLSSERYHLPPSAHSTFVMRDAVVCTFLPRPLETGDDKAMKVPFYHSNIDFDEVLFYHAGNFFSRDGIAPGMLTLHPQGIHHGPQAQAIARSRDLQRTDEIAVMIDTRRPLRTSEVARTLEVSHYWKSWQPGGAR